jgi:hypothetical protein
VSNQGGAPAADVVVEDTLPTFLALVDASASRGEVTTADRTVRVTVGTLAPGETVEVRVNARLTAAAVAPNNRNLAVVSSSSPDANTGNNQASVALESPAPAVPAALPRTSGESALPLLMTILGITLLAASGMVRREGRRRVRK